MLQAHLEDNENEIVTTGQVEAGDIYPDFCCSGFDWEINSILYSIYGTCHNPDCPIYDKEIDSDPYRGVTAISPEDFEEKLAVPKKAGAVNG